MVRSSGLLTSDSQTNTSRSASGNGIGFNSNELITLNIVVFAPIPSASVMIATNVNPGFLNNIREPYRKSCQSVCISSFQSGSRCQVPGVRFQSGSRCQVPGLYLMQSGFY